MRSVGWRAVGTLVWAVGVVVALTACSATFTDVSPNGHHGDDSGASGAAGSTGQEMDAAGVEVAPPPGPDALAPIDDAGPDADASDLVDASPEAAISDARTEDVTSS